MVYEPQQENRKNTKYLAAVAAIVVGIGFITTANMHERPGHRPPVLGIILVTLGIIYLFILLFRSGKK